MSNFETALKEVFFVEGGYSDHPEDGGGKTQYGITELTYQKWQNTFNGVQNKNIKDITKQEASTIYREMYWDKIRGDELPRGVSLMVFDSAVHAGPTRAIWWLQRAVDAKTDGVIGPITLKLVNQVDVSRDFRLRVVKEIAKSRLMLARSNEAFVSGWFNRILTILLASIEGVSDCYFRTMPFDMDKAEVKNIT